MDCNGKDKEDNHDMPDTRNATFEEMKLHVGERLQLVLHRPHDTAHYSSLIGYSTGQYLLVKVPTENGVSVPMREGEKMTVRVFSGEAVYSFDTVADLIQLSPHYYMHLRFPTTIQATPLREAPRVKINMPVQIWCASDATPKLAILSDLSISGAYLTADSELGKPGDVISIALSFHVKPTNQEVSLALDGIIRSCHPITEHGAANRYGVGVHFDGVAPADQVMLQHYLYEAEMG